MTVRFEDHTSMVRRVLRMVRLRKRRIEAVTGVPLGRRIGCGVSGCAYRSVEDTVAKLSGSKREAAMWSSVSAEQDDDSQLANEAFPPILGVWELQWRDDPYVMVWRRSVEMAFEMDKGVLRQTRATRERGWNFEGDPMDPFPRDWAAQSFDFRVASEAILLAIQVYRLWDVHLGNLGWYRNRLVIFDAETHMEPPELPAFALNPASGNV